MQLCDDLTEQRAKTIAHWASFRYPRTEVDINRVYAFRELDPATATNEDVSRAYGGPGWAHIEPCAECGSEGRRVKVGGVVLCEVCIDGAYDLLWPPPPPHPVPGTATDEPPKRGFFSKLLGG